MPDNPIPVNATTLQRAAVMLAHGNYEQQKEAAEFLLAVIHKKPIYNPLAVPWRVGSHYGIHVYAEVDPNRDNHMPIATCHDKTVAERIVQTHNEALKTEQYAATVKSN